MSDSERVIIATFTRPDSASKHVLLQQLREMPMSAFHVPHEQLVGTAEDAANHIHDILINDSIINEDECAEWAGGFEYELGFEGNDARVLHVRTRLFPLANPGQSVLYVSTVRRTGLEQYSFVDAHSRKGRFKGVTNWVARLPRRLFQYLSGTWRQSGRD